MIVNRLTFGVGLPTTMHSNLTDSPSKTLARPGNASANDGFSSFSSKRTRSVGGFFTAVSNVEMALTMTCEKHLASPALFTALAVYCPLSSARALWIRRVAVPSSSVLNYTETQGASQSHRTEIDRGREEA